LFVFCGNFGGDSFGVCNNRAVSKQEGLYSMSDCAIEEHYMLGVSIKETIGMLLRVHNELHDVVMALQDRVLDLEMKNAMENNDE
jgi:hypothetical protein